MQYFTKELWQGMNRPDEAVRREAEAQWKKNNSLYWKRIGRIRKKIPDAFFRCGTVCRDFHDYEIQGISFLQTGREHATEIRLSGPEGHILLTLGGVRSFRIDVVTFTTCIMRQLSWGYSELDLTPEGDIRLSVLCDLENELEFQFKTAEISINA